MFWSCSTTKPACGGSTLDLSGGLIMTAAAVMAIGCALQAAVGFGFALFSAPLLLLIDPRFVPGPILLAALPLCLWSAWRERDAIKRPQMRLLLIGVAVGTLAGVAALTALAGADLTRVFAGMILVAIALSLIATNIRVTPANLLIGSAAGGFMGAMVGVHGPPAALVLQHEEPAAVRAMLGAYFAAAYALAVVALWWAGLFIASDFGRALAILPGTFAGMLAGPWLSRLVDRRRSRIAILVVSAASAFALMMR